MVGRTIAHYKIVEQLGAGGGGAVYLAHDERLDRRVALKLLPPELAQDPENLERFRREARALAALNHPSIVTIYSVEEEASTHFLTMEYVPGTTLAAAIPENGMSLEAFLRIARPLTEALCAAHAHGIIHRDLKPANVMVRADGSIKILDFGLAKRSREEAPDGNALLTITRPGMLMGTLQYMSPEQIEGKPADARSDLFALGAIFHEMLTGRRPFRGESGPTLISSIFRDLPIRVTDYRPGLPPALAAMILRCLEKDPAARYQDSTELRDELLGVQEEEDGTRREEAFEASPSATPASISTADSSAPGIHRRSGRRAWFLLPALLVLAAAVYVPMRWLRPPSSKRIVVLPFENLGAADDAYFALGITEEITSRLSAVPGLGVISRTSALQYDAAGKTMKQIGRDLGVGYVLEGTVRWDRGAAGGSRVLVTPQLIRVADDTHLWSERYERNADAIFQVQAEIAGQVVQRLDVALGERARRALETTPTTNLDAHLAYLRGMAYGRGATEDDSRAAVQMLEKAVALDPEFLEAWFRLSRARAYLYSTWIEHTPEMAQSVREAAERALALAPDRSEGHMALGNYYYRVLSDYDRAVSEFESALRIRPDDSGARFDIGFIKAMRGDWETGRVMMEAALDLDPRNADICESMADLYQRLRRFPEAEQMLDRAISILPDDLLAWWRKVDLYWCWDGTPERARKVLSEMPPRLDYESTRLWWCQEFYERNWQAALDRISSSPWEWYGDFPRAYLEYACLVRLNRAQPARTALEAARVALESRVREAPDDPGPYGVLGVVYAALGRREDALRAGARISELSSISQDAFYGPDRVIWQAKIDAMLGEPGRAVERLENLLAIPSCTTPGILRLDPDWDRIRGDPGFRKLAGETS